MAYKQVNYSASFFVVASPSLQSCTCWWGGVATPRSEAGISPIPNHSSHPSSPFVHPDA